MHGVTCAADVEDVWRLTRASNTCSLQHRDTPDNNSSVAWDFTSANHKIVREGNGRTLPVLRDSGSNAIFRSSQVEKILKRYPPNWKAVSIEHARICC